MHEDQFTAKGPPIAGSGVPRTGFSTNGNAGMEYGASVGGNRAGVVGTCGAEAGRDSDVEGVGVHGSGNTIGVFGKTVSGGIARVTGVYGQDNQGNVGVLGAVMRGGSAVAGVNMSSLGNPLQTFDNLPNPGTGNGTGVFGTSGSGTGVHGTSNTGFGVHAVSETNTAVVASSTDGFGVHGIATTNTAVVAQSTSGFGLHGISQSNTAVVGESAAGFGVHGIAKGAGDGVRGSSVNGSGGVFESQIAAQVRLIPGNLASPEGRMNGGGGELFATTVADESGTRFALWFCARGGDLNTTVWDLVGGTRPFPGTQFADGAKGTQVKHIQLRLNMVAGAGLMVDGDFGPRTRQSVVNFQNAAGIAADGIVGPVTWKRLFDPI